MSTPPLPPSATSPIASWLDRLARLSNPPKMTAPLPVRDTSGRVLGDVPVRRKHVPCIWDQDLSREQKGKP